MNATMVLNVKNLHVYSLTATTLHFQQSQKSFPPLTIVGTVEHLCLHNDQHRSGCSKAQRVMINIDQDAQKHRE